MRTFAGEIATSAMHKRTYTGAADVRPPWGDNAQARGMASRKQAQIHAAQERQTFAHGGDDTATATAFVAAVSAVRRALVEALARVRYSKHGS